MENNTIRFAIVVDPPRVFPNYDTMQKPGVYIDIIRLFCQMMNFTCILEKATDDGVYGYTDKHGTWRGVVGYLEDGLYDISVPGFAITEERFDVIDFSFPVYMWDLVLVTRGGISTNNFSLLSTIVYHWTVWICLIIVSSVIGFFIAFIKMPISNGKFCFECLNQSLDSFSLISSQSNISNITRTSVRFLITLWALLVIVVTGLYSGHVVSSIITYSSKLPFGDLLSFVECLERSQCRLIFHKDAKYRRPYQAIFSDNYSLLHKRLSDAVKGKVLMTNSFKQTFTTIHNDEEHYYATVVYYEEYLYITNRNIDCSFTYIKIGADSVGFPMVKNFTFKDNVNKFADNIVTSGLATKLYYNYLGFEQICQRTITNELDPVSIGKFCGSLVILMVGSSIGFGAFTLEMCNANFKKIKDKVRSVKKCQKCHIYANKVCQIK